MKEIIYKAHNCARCIHYAEDKFSWTVFCSKVNRKLPKNIFNINFPKWCPFKDVEE